MTLPAFWIAVAALIGLDYVTRVWTHVRLAGSRTLWVQWAARLSRPGECGSPWVGSAELERSLNVGVTSHLAMLILMICWLARQYGR